MNMKEAATLAKVHFLDLFGQEGFMDVALEEVVFDRNANEWLVTLSYRRTIDDDVKNNLIFQLRSGGRGKKYVKLDDDSGNVISVTDALPSIAA